MPDETKLSASLSQIDKIDKLKGTSNYLVWRQEFEDLLKLLDMWHYISTDNVLPVVGGDVTAADRSAWVRAHDKIYTMLKSRCEKNPRAKINTKTNASDAWNALKEFKPRGSGMLNSTFKKLETLTLASCDGDPQSYADKFQEILEEIENLSEKRQFGDNWKIYRFHTGLGSQYNAYFKQYNQNHDAFNNDGSAKFSLNYAITRFINTVTNPSDTTSIEAQALVALINDTFGHTSSSVIALVAAGGAHEVKIQQGAHAGNSRTYTQTCKHYNHCNKD